MQARWKERIEDEQNNFLPLSSNFVQSSLTSISMSVMFYCIHESYKCIHRHYIKDLFLRKDSQNCTLSVSKSSHTHTGWKNGPLFWCDPYQKYIGMILWLFSSVISGTMMSHHTLADASKLVNYDILFPGKLEDVLRGVLERDICQDKPIHISPEQLATVSMECQ